MPAAKRVSSHMFCIVSVRVCVRSDQLSVCVLRGEDVR